MDYSASYSVYGITSEDGDAEEAGIASEAGIDLEDGVSSGTGTAPIADVAAPAIDFLPTMFATKRAADTAQDLDTIWERIAAGKPTSKDVVVLLMMGGIPGVCGPGRTAEEREMIMKHNRPRVEVASRVLATPACVHRGRRPEQRPVTTVASSEEDLLSLLGGTFAPSNISRSSTTETVAVYLLYFFTFAALALWMYFAIPVTVSRPEVWISARDWLDAPDWIWWVSFSFVGLSASHILGILNEQEEPETRYTPALYFSRMALCVLGLNVVLVILLKWTVQGVDSWDSDSTGGRVGTVFLVFACSVYVMICSALTPAFENSADVFDVPEGGKPLKISTESWQPIRLCAAPILRVEHAMGRLEDRAGLFQMCECLFELLDNTEVENAVEHGTNVRGRYSALVWLCLDALAHLPQNQRNPEFALSTVCSFGVTFYDCFSSICGWYVTEPALAPILASKTGRTDESVPTFCVGDVKDGRPRTSKDGAYVEKSSGVVGMVQSFDPRGVRTAGQTYSSSCSAVRVTIPPRQQPSASEPDSEEIFNLEKIYHLRPKHTGWLGLINTAAAVWFLVHWEDDVYHVFLAAAVCGELWAQLWVGIWWCSGEAPFTAFVDPVHWLLSQRKRVPDGAVRLLAGEASAAVLGAVAALTVIDQHVAGGVLGTVALVIAAVLKIWVKGEDIAVVCFVAYVSELIIEVIIMVTYWNFALVNLVLGVTAALESMFLTIWLLQVLVGRSLIGGELPDGTELDKVKENLFARSVACGYWGAVFTGHRPMFIMESTCSGMKKSSPDVVAQAKSVGYEEAFRAGSLRTVKEPGWGYVVSGMGSETSTAWGLPAATGFTVFEVGSWYGKRYPCL